MCQRRRLRRLPLAGQHFELAVQPFNHRRTEGMPRPHHRAFSGGRFISGEYQAGVLLAGCETTNDDIVRNLLRVRHVVLLHFSLSTASRRERRGLAPIVIVVSYDVPCPWKRADFKSNLNQSKFARIQKLNSLRKLALVLQRIVYP
jgi:hypothetical protein